MTQKKPLFYEMTPAGFGLAVEVNETLCTHQSPYQEIVILDTSFFGKMMVIDGCVMLTEKDEYIYHEMLVHPAACCHGSPRRALIVGGGDGGTARELLRHPTIESIDLVEIDEAVVRLSQQYLPTVSEQLSDPKVNLHFRDGTKFLAEVTEPYDLIMIDSTDPVGPAAGLITQDFYRNCKQVLSPGGILTLQSESPLLHQQELGQIYENVGAIFSHHHLYHAPIMTYPTGWWSFLWCSEDKDPHTHFSQSQASQLEQTLKYYNQDVHSAAFVLPNVVRKLLARKTLDSYPLEKENNRVE